VRRLPRALELPTPSLPISSADRENELDFQANGRSLVMKILFVGGFGPIVDNDKRSYDLYVVALGLPLKKLDVPKGWPDSSDYLSTEDLQGVKAFALWPLPLVAKACFGNTSWPSDIQVPHAWINFEVENLEKATAELQSQGYRLIVAGKQEWWGQTATRLVSSESLLVGITVTPRMRGSTESKSRG
jgi:hypothetical protein